MGDKLLHTNIILQEGNASKVRALEKLLKRNSDQIQPHLKLTAECRQSIPFRKST